MKQEGSMWIDHKGQRVPKEYIGKEVQQKERALMAMVNKAIKAHQQMHSLKQYMIQQFYKFKKIEEGQVTQTLFSFDRSVKIQIDRTDNPNFRVYVSDKRNPEQGDYKLVRLDIHSLNILESMITNEDFNTKDNEEDARIREIAKKDLEERIKPGYKEEEGEEEIPWGADTPVVPESICEEGEIEPEGDPEPDTDPIDTEPVHSQEPEFMPGGEATED